MQQNARQLAFGAIMGIAGLALILVVIALFTVYTGSYNVAATWDHPPLMRWGLTTAMKNSVSAQALDIDTPERFTQDQIAAGAARYKAVCQQCHGGPGVEKADWASGMLPQPPHLPDVIPEWEPHEVFWLVKHGIRLTGMPALGPTHDDAAIWDITAFAMELPGMTSGRYVGFGPDSNEHQH